MHYAASLDLRVELRRKKKRNKPCAFRKTSHDALYARNEIGGWRSTDAHSGASTFFKEYRLITCAAGVFRAFQYTRLRMQIRNNEPLSPIVTRQRRIRQRICKGRKEKCRFVASSDAPQMRPSSSNFNNFLRPHFHIIRYCWNVKSVCLVCKGK